MLSHIDGVAIKVGHSDLFKCIPRNLIFTKWHKLVDDMFLSPDAP